MSSQKTTFNLGDKVIFTHDSGEYKGKIIGTPALDTYTKEQLIDHKATYPNYPYDPNDPRLQGNNAKFVRMPLWMYVIEFDDPSHTPQGNPIITIQTYDLDMLKHNNAQGGRRKMKGKSKKSRKAKRKSRGTLRR